MVKAPGLVAGGCWWSWFWVRRSVGAGGSGGDLRPEEPGAAALVAGVGDVVRHANLVVLGLVNLRLRVTAGGVPSRGRGCRGRGDGTTSPGVPDLGLARVRARRYVHVADDGASRRTLSLRRERGGRAREGQRRRCAGRG